MSHVLKMLAPWKIPARMRLLLDDPERFFKNIQQYTNPEKYLAQLLNISRPQPLTISVDPSLGARPCLNLLLPTLSEHMTGGPNTALTIAYRVAAKGMGLRIIAADRPIQGSKERIWSHIATLTGLPAQLPGVEMVETHDRSRPLPIGANDLFMATHWTTAQLAHAAASHTSRGRFLYLIQDFEPGFYPWSSNHAQSLATYDMAFRPVINQKFLADYLVDQRIGRFATPGFFQDQGIAFEPAVDRRFFYPQPRQNDQKRRLLFYARPSNHRNMIGLGYHALEAALKDPVFAKADWEFLTIGGGMPDLLLPGGRMLKNAPWRGYAAYAELLRSSDILLSLMLSPHTSYPVLEMAACGHLVVTNSFSSKTGVALEALSPNILAVGPTVDGVCEGIVAAARRIDAGEVDTRPVNLPASWDDALAAVDQWIFDQFD